MKKIFWAIAAVLLLSGCTPKEKKNTSEAGKEAAETEVAAEGKTAPDFTLNGPDGTPVSLSSLRGKFVVVDFWGTWCKWCVKGIPHMKAYYEKYEGKFEMLSIDFGDDEETWRKAIESYDMNWLHVITDKDSGEKLQELYAIEGFPTKIVVDPEGKIVHITVGEDPKFYEFLDDLFE